MIAVTIPKIMRKLFLALVVACMTMTLTLGLANAQSASDLVCEGLGEVSGQNGCEDPAGSPSLDTTVESVINILSVIVGAISVVMVIIGGLKFVASRGDSSGINSGRNTIIYAIVGLIIVVLAQVIVRFVVNTTNDEINSSSQSIRPDARTGPR